MVVLATPQDMVARYDVRRIGDLLSDNDVRVSETAVLTNTILLEILEDASAMVVSALLAGGKTLDEIQRIAQSSVSTPAKNLLIRITCDLAFGLLLRRRGFSAKDIAFAAPGYSVAEQMLMQMKSGVFALPVEELERANFAKVVRLATSPRYVTDEMYRALAEDVWPKREF